MREYISPALSHEFVVLCCGSPRKPMWMSCGMLTGGGTEFPVHVACGPRASDRPDDFPIMLIPGPLHIPLEAESLERGLEKEAGL